MARLETEPQAVIHAVPLWRYYKAADGMYMQAMQYRQARNTQQEYQQLFQYASLVIDTIPKHKDAAQYTTRHGGYRKMLQTNVMPRLEQLKALIKAEPAPAAHYRRANVTRMGFANSVPGVDWADSQPVQAPSSSIPANYLEHNATVERVYSNAAASTSAPPAAPGDPFAASYAFGGQLTVAPPPQLRGAQQDWSASNGHVPQSPLALPINAPALPHWASQIAVPSAGQRYLSKHSLMAPKTDQDQSIMPAARQPLYPLCKLPDRLVGFSPMGDPPKVLALPPQEIEVHNQIVYEVVAPAPGAVCDHCESAPGVPQPAAPPKSAPERNELRDVYIAPHVMESFLRHAIENTRRGIESCGILAGTLSSDSSSFTVSTLIIPKQKGEANVVEMLNEEEIFDYQFERGLMPLGWIHTHPTQTCFLSSIDVHTQCGYQVMLAESVAIVMAPTDPRQKCGIFRLTTPGGMSVVQSCQQRGFHQHPVPDTKQEIYELCGHVFLDETAKYECIDLR